MATSYSAPYRNRHVLVSGGGGYIGSAVVTALLDMPCHITVLDRQPKPSWIPATSAAVIEWHEGDVGEKASWQVAAEGVDTIWHLAAIEAPYSPETIQDDYTVNSLSVVRMIEAVRELELRPHVILASSANIYGHVDHVPVGEDTPDNPERIWSAHKLLAEQYLKILSSHYKMPATILRLANVYGPTSVRGSDDHIIPNKVIRLALTTHKLTLFANAQCTRDYIYLEDVVAALLAAGHKVPVDCATYIVGSGEGVTIAEAWRLMADVLKKVTTREVVVSVDTTRELDAAEYRNFIADSRRFTAATGWQAATSLEEGLTRTAEWSLKK